MLQYLQENKLKVISGIVAFITTIISTAFAVDSRYAKEAEVEQYKKDNAAQYRVITVQQSRSIDNLRKQQLEDKLFELDLKKTLTDAERAMKARWLRELDSLNQKFDKSKDVPEN